MTETQSPYITTGIPGSVKRELLHDVEKLKRELADMITTKISLKKQLLRTNFRIAVLKTAIMVKEKLD